MKSNTNETNNGNHKDDNIRNNYNSNNQVNHNNNQTQLLNFARTKKKSIRLLFKILPTSLDFLTKIKNKRVKIIQLLIVTPILVIDKFIRCKTITLSCFVRCMLRISNNQFICGKDDNTILLINLNDIDNPKTLNGHTGKISCLANLYKDKFVSGSEDSSIKLWDLSTKITTTLIGHKDKIISLIRLNINQLVSSSFDKAFKVWDLTNFTCINSIKAPSINCKIIKHNENHIISSSPKSIQVWNITTSRCQSIIDLSNVFILFKLNIIKLLIGRMGNSFELVIWDLEKNERKYIRQSDEKNINSIIKLNYN